MAQRLQVLGAMAPTYSPRHHSATALESSLQTGCRRSGSTIDRLLLSRPAALGLQGRLSAVPPAPTSIRYSSCAMYPPRGSTGCDSFRGAKPRVRGNHPATGLRRRVADPASINGRFQPRLFSAILLSIRNGYPRCESPKRLIHSRSLTFGSPASLSEIVHRRPCRSREIRGKHVGNCSTCGVQQHIRVQKLNTTLPLGVSRRLLQTSVVFREMSLGRADHSSRRSPSPFTEMRH